MAAPTYSMYSFYQPVAPKKKLGPKDPWTAQIAAPNTYEAGQPVDYSGFAPVAPFNPAPTVTGPPGSIRAPGYDPDYAALIAGDPTLIAGQSDLDMFSGQLSDRKRAAIRSAIINAGLVPGGVPTGDIDQATIEAAKQNPWSGAAELERGRGRGIADNAAQLAGRGILSSGALTGGNNMVQEAFGRGTSQLTNQLLGLITGYEEDFSDKMAGVRSQYQTLRENAALRVQSDPRYQPIGETDAVLDPVSGLYMTPDGRWYNANRERVNAPPVSPSAPSPAPIAQPQTQPPPPITSYPLSRPVQNVVPGRNLRAQ